MSSVPSPCVKLCRMHPTTGWCEGCHRTIDEIAAWSRLDDAAKQVVWLQLKQRASQASRPDVLTTDTPPAQAGVQVG